MSTDWNEVLTNSYKTNPLEQTSSSSFKPIKGRDDALRYAMKMGMSDSVRGIQQMYGNIANDDELLESLKSKDEKLKRILEHRYARPE